MLMLLRKRAALWAGAGLLGLAGAATSFAAAGLGSSSPDDPPPDDTGVRVLVQESGPQAEGDADGGGTEQSVEVQAETVLGVPEDSPACENVGCGEVENAGGVTLHLPQPAVDGITRAAEKRAAARDKGDEDEEAGDEPAAEDTAADEETAEDAVRGVPEDSPACDKAGCGEVVNAGGVTLHLPQPAVDGIEKAAEHRAAAQDKSQGGGDDPGATSSGKPAGKPDHAGPPAHAGKP